MEVCCINGKRMINKGLDHKQSSSHSKSALDVIIFLCHDRFGTATFICVIKTCPQVSNMLQHYYIFLLPFAHDIFTIV